MEIASCLDFLWKKQAKKELQDMSEMRRHTNQLGDDFHFYCFTLNSSCF